MRPRTRPEREPGFTLVEMVVAILIYGVVLAAGIGFVAMDNTLFHRGLDRMTALQNVRYVLSALEADVPALGTNVPVRQPSVVYAGPDVLAFSADHTSNTPNDILATYVDPKASGDRVMAPDPGVTIPRSDGVRWPSVVYADERGGRSPAELLLFWFAPDTATGRADDYVLFRQVNAGPPEPIARNLLRSGRTPFFQYVRAARDLAGRASPAVIAESELPLLHASPYHGEAADTAASSLADSIRAVRVTFRGTNGRSGDEERSVSASRLIDLPNARVHRVAACGDEPTMGDTLGVRLVDRGGGDWVSRLTWTASADEVAGRRDVMRYVIYRRSLPGDDGWGDPFVSIPAGLPRYTYEDHEIAPGKTYQYAVAAQDCTPLQSTLEASSPVVVPQG